MMSREWDEAVKIGQEMFLSGKTFNDVIIASNDRNRAGMLYGYQESFQGRNFDVEIEEQREHFDGLLNPQ
jgi:hypothetical protein